MINITDREKDMIINALNSHIEKLNKIINENNSDKSLFNVVSNLRIEYVTLWEKFIVEKSI